MSEWPKLELGSVATIERAIALPADIDGKTLYIGLENIERGGAIIDVDTVSKAEISSAKFQFTSQHVLFGKLRPYLAKIARPNFDGVCSTDILPISPGTNLDRDYLNHFLLLPDSIAFAASRVTGANLPRLAPNTLEKFQIPCPPISEQRRIAQVLDSVDALRTKRREAIALLDNLAQSIFLDMFGDPARNPYDWKLEKFQNVLETPLRNGLSPSSGGKVHRKVLTLSSVTGAKFDPSSLKISTFNSPPPRDQSVRSTDFLICRGNGNLNLVGRGQFPTLDMPDTTFPDTIISARPSPGKILPSYLTYFWKSSMLRQQIKSVARTTNGTFKVNQTMLEQIFLPVPPFELQESFSRKIQKISVVQSSHQDHLAELDALFASLQDRAFRGKLWDGAAS